MVGIVGGSSAEFDPGPGSVLLGSNGADDFFFSSDAPDAPAVPALGPIGAVLVGRR